MIARQHPCVHIVDKSMRNRCDKRLILAHCARFRLVLELMRKIVVCNGCFMDWKNCCKNSYRQKHGILGNHIRRTRKLLAPKTSALINSLLGLSGLSFCFLKCVEGLNSLSSSLPSSSFVIHLIGFYTPGSNLTVMETPWGKNKTRNSMNSQGFPAYVKFHPRRYIYRKKECGAILDLKIQVLTAFS